MAEKMSVKAQAEVRATLYSAAREAVEALGYATETIATGALVHLPDGQYAEVNISIKDPTLMGTIYDIIPFFYNVVD